MTSPKSVLALSAAAASFRRALVRLGVSRFRRPGTDSEAVSPTRGVAMMMHHGKDHDALVIDQVKDAIRELAEQGATGALAAGTTGWAVGAAATWAKAALTANRKRSAA